MRFFCVPLFACNRQVDSIDKRQCNLTHIERYSRTLEELLLDMNHIKLLPKGLVELNISRNDISDLPDELKECRQLLILDATRLDHGRPITHALGVERYFLTKLPQGSSIKPREGRHRPANGLEIAGTCAKTICELFRPPSPTWCTCSGLDLGQNELDELVGRMKRLNILKASDNNLTRLTPAIGSCSALTELFLQQNLLSELPSTIGNLAHLSDLNRLTRIKSHRELLFELPLEIGKLSHLRVLDVCGNKLSYLPYTINVLYELQALWLSENQSQAMLKLTQETDAKTGIRVLTCYLLPQQSAHPQDSEASKPAVRTGEFVGGPKVHFGDSEEPEEGLKVVGNFERKDTPHPKPGVQGQKLKKQHVDGHVVPHDERRPSVVSLTKKSSSTEIPEMIQRTRNGPKSSLKHPPVHNTPAGVEASSYIPTSTPPPKEKGLLITWRKPPTARPLTAFIRTKRSAFTFQDRNVAFTLPSTSKTPEPEAQECRLKRASQTSLSASDPNSNCETKRLIIRRDSNAGLGLSIAGGVESTPFINNDTGLFVSKLTPGAPAERAGLRIGDKLLEVNGTSMVNQRHDVAVQCMQKNTSAVELVIQRGPSASEKSKSLDSNRFPAAPVEPPARQTNGTPVGAAPEIVSTTIVREPNHPLGMSMLHTNEVKPNRSPLRIQYIAQGGPIDRDGKLRVGDEVISINGINLKGMRFDDALSLLQSANTDAKNAKELHLVVAREAAVPLARSEPPRPLQAGELPYGDRSLDGLIEEVELMRDSKNSLGLSIVGGIDHCSHPFGIDRPGVFVSKISANSPASRSKKLRVGDRILTVNGRNVAQAKHADAVDLLKNSGLTLRLGVCHEPQPKGLREVFFTRRPGEPIGLTIFGRNRWDARQSERPAR
ncbi:hypothetical protein M3Y99_00057800 [Aphelenchoides fujianensis]|nr:hypothetical protein M3Y99_00057800 [Aphelenchoides fujianensis]